MLEKVGVTSQKDVSDATLQRFDAYIVAQVHQIGYNYARHVPPSVLDLELDEVIQLVRIKFWQALEKRDIRYPYAYIKLIIQSQFIDMLRCQKRCELVSLNEEFAHSATTFDALCVSDAAEMVEQQMDALAHLKEMIQAVLALPPRQRYAIICSLKEHADDLKLLMEAFKAYKIDIQTIQWPTGKVEKQVLKASLGPARKTLARTLVPQLLAG